MRRKIYRFLAIFFVINIVIILCSSNPTTPAEFQIKDNLSIKNNWQIWVGKNNKQKEVVSFENVIYNADIGEPFILITTNMPVNIYVEEKLVKSFSKIKKVGSEVDNFAWHLARLPSDCFGKKIRLEFEEDDSKLLLKQYVQNKGSCNYKIEGVMIGTEQELLYRILLEDVKYVAISSVFIISGIILICLYFITKIKYGHKMNCHYIAAGLLCFGFWILCDSQLLMFIFNSATVYYIKCICIFSMPVFMLRYTEVEFETTNKKYIATLGIIQMSLSIIIMLLHIFLLIPLNVLTQLMWGMFFVNEFLCIIFLFPDIVKNTRVRDVFMGHIIAYTTVCTYVIIIFKYVSRVETKYLLMCLIFFLIYYAIEIIKRILRLMDILYKKTMLEVQFDEQIMYYKMMEKSDNILKKIIHDMKNHWRVLLMLLNEGKNKEALFYSNEVMSDLEVSEKETVICTGNAFFDAILTIKIKYAEERNINVDTEIMVIKDMKIDSLDYSILFGNILDNAIEACENMDEKWIKIKIFYKKNMLICKIANSANTENLSSNIIGTTKKNKLLHGVGIGNVKDVIEKYNGNFELKSISDTAIATFVLYNV